MAALVESMFYVRETPWHGLGVNVEEAADSKNALVLAGLDWEVEKKDVIVPGCSSITDYKATVRTADNTVLGIVSDRYKIVQNEDAFSFVDNIVDGLTLMHITYLDAILKIVHELLVLLDK